MRFTTSQRSSPLVGQLQDWFNTWLNRPPGTEEWQLLYELVAEGLPDLVDQLTPSELQQWVRTWNKRLILSLSQEMPRERILCAFTCVEDTIYRLDQTEVDEFVRWAASEMGLAPEDFVSRAAQRVQSGKNGQGGELLKECYDLVDVLAALLYAWQPERSGLRPAMMDAGLRDQMDTYVRARQSARPQTVITLLGGAAGNMANALRGLGLPVAVHWAYHASDLASLCPGCLQRMRFSEGQKNYSPAQKSGSPDDPKRRSIIFSYSPEPGLVLRPAPSLIPNLPSWQPMKIDRQIYRYPFYVRTEGRGWTEMFLANGSGKRTPILDPSNQILRGEGWPFLPLFGEWQVQGSDFVFTVANDALMEKVADQFDYVILSGLQGLGDPLLNLRDSARDVNAPARSLILQALQQQLRLLAQRGVRLHLEISGIADLQVAGWVGEIIRNTVKSAGINQEELEQITGTQAFAGSPFFVANRPGSNDRPEPFTHRYERARQLARAFHLDELYVHGNDADLILVRGVPRGAIWQELLADLFAKGIVVLALLERSLPNNWQQIAAQLSIILKRDGFLALLALADQIARNFFRQPDEQAALLRDIAFTGYWFNRNPQDYSVIVVPVMWPELPSDLSTAGAGDAVSATFTVLGRK